MGLTGGAALRRRIVSMLTNRSEAPFFWRGSPRPRLPRPGSAPNTPAKCVESSSCAGPLGRSSAENRAARGRPERELRVDAYTDVRELVLLLPRLCRRDGCWRRGGILNDQRDDLHAELLVVREGVGVAARSALHAPANNSGKRPSVLARAATRITGARRSPCTRNRIRAFRLRLSRL